MPVNSCPKCGAMIVPQLARCRQCRTYLHGTPIEGFFFEQVVPSQVSRSPGTATLCLLICLYYALMLVLAGRDSMIGFSNFTLQQLGATHVPSIMLGQYWRFVTSIFGHHDLLHLVFNLASLVIVGDLVERIFDKKKMMLIYLVSGVASMMLSHVWYAVLKSDLLTVSAGASGAVCGLIGAALFGARKLGPQGAEVERRMKRWAIFMVIWGFAAPGINNAAHFGGFAVGALLARLTPVGIAKEVKTQKILSVAMLVILAVVLGCVGLMVDNLRGFPAALENDARPRSILGQLYYAGTAFEFSDQVMIHQACRDAAAKKDGPLDDAIKKCELNVRVNPSDGAGYVLLASLLDQKRPGPRADRLRMVGRRIEAALSQE